MSNTLDNFYKVSGENNTINRFKDQMIISFSDTLQGSSHGFKDSVGGIVLSRYLTYVDPKVLTKQYPDNLLSATSIIVDNSGGSAFNDVVSVRTDRTGGFKTVNGNATNSGVISVFGDLDRIKSYQREAFSNWTKREVEQAQLGQFNLPNKILEAHNSQFQKELSDVLIQGIEVNQGLMNNTYFDSTSASGTIDTLNPQQVYNELAELINSQSGAVSNTSVYKTSEVIMPISVYNYAESHFLNNTNGDSFTVLTALRNNYPNVNFLASWQAETVANGGVLAQSAVLAFNSSEDSMIFRLPGQLEFTEVNHTLNNFQIGSDYSVVGIDIKERKSGKFLLGLAD